MKTVFLKNTDKPIVVSKILCIGQNYAEHAKELNFEVPRAPVFFLKPTTALLQDGGTVLLPPISTNVHHEVELVVLIGEGGKKIPEAEALNHVAGYGVGLDMTLRDVQAEAKKKGLPWTLAKGFDTSAPVSQFVPKEAIDTVNNLNLELTVNGVVRQRGACRDMVFSIERLIAYISRFLTLEQGDLIFTGTPPGVGAVVANDVIQGTLRYNDSILTTVTVNLKCDTDV